MSEKVSNRETLERVAREVLQLTDKEQINAFVCLMVYSIGLS
ncbi:hypothetical protein [Alkalibacter mobilis]|nr:hypothetical protein [Alkalibacter mobilis]